MIYDALDLNHHHRAFSPVCSYCTRLLDIGLHKCGAFPRGIPLEIWAGRNSHVEPYDDDGGLLFERRGSANQILAE